ncbi:hypothetical protein BD311DRAFT_113667 [Dichomitus squalens]|uniref:Uncharacterized protein n=1 Tax=Dichomitus squalens TaxID=114155 RepID=A0A4Q9M8X0_9APHY|nr:hypothetical protein BD311DRAFT_113667 [Dichomitus squalens]
MGGVRAPVACICGWTYLPSATLGFNVSSHPRYLFLFTTSGIVPGVWWAWWLCRALAPHSAGTAASLKHPGIDPEEARTVRSNERCCLVNVFPTRDEIKAVHMIRLLLKHSWRRL